MKKVSDEQGAVLILLIILLILEVARSSNVKAFFKNAGSASSTALSNNAQGKANASTATSTLDWHLFAYWGGAGLLAVIMAGVAPEFVMAILILVILEELLTHWSVYAAYLSPPTK